MYWSWYWSMQLQRSTVVVHLQLQFLIRGRPRGKVIGLHSTRPLLEPSSTPPRPLWSAPSGSLGTENSLCFPLFSLHDRLTGEAARSNSKCTYPASIFKVTAPFGYPKMCDGSVPMLHDRHSFQGEAAPCVGLGIGLCNCKG